MFFRGSRVVDVESLGRGLLGWSVVLFFYGFDESVECLAEVDGTVVESLSKGFVCQGAGFGEVFEMIDGFKSGSVGVFEEFDVVRLVFSATPGLDDVRFG